MEKWFENEKAVVEGLRNAEESKPLPVWFALTSGSSPWKELSVELKAYFGEIEMFFRNTKPCMN